MEPIGLRAEVGQREDKDGSAELQPMAVSRYFHVDQAFTTSSLAL